MIRILQIGLNSNPGGIENCILNYHRFIDKAQFTFDYVDIYGHGLAYEDEIMDLGGKIYSLPNYKHRPLFVMKKLYNICIENKYDIIHINMLSAANMIPVLAAYKSKGTVIVHSHNSNVPSGILRKVMNRVNLKILRSFPVEKWACSIKAGKWMWGESFSPEYMIPNAIDIDKFSRHHFIREIMREKCGFKDTDIVLGFVGRFSEQKNILFIPEILAELRKRSTNFKLLLVGDGILKEKLKEKINDLHIQNEVFLAGIQNNTAEWYQAMDVFILPSLFEGFPVVGVEAQALSIPCFMSNRITDEINITGMVTYLSIDNGSKIWAESIFKTVFCKNIVERTFPTQYIIKFAVKNLETRYKDLIVNKYN